MKKLDIIVPHYNEAWSVGKKFFDMLALQRMADFDQMRVIFINDGEESNLFPTIVEQRYPYEVAGVVIPHAGVSAARNKGLEMSDAEWVMFCDFDDTFSSIYSLHCFLDTLDDPNCDKYDLIWWNLWDEYADGSGVRIRDQYERLMLHAKIFRRSTLNEHNLRFNEAFRYGEDTAFLNQFDMEIPFERVGHVKSSLVPYVWTYRADSVVSNPANWWRNNVDLFRRQVFVANEWEKHGHPEKRDALYVRALCDAFVALNRTDVDENEQAEFLEEVKTFIQEARKLSVSHDLLEKALTSSIIENHAEGALKTRSSEFLTWAASIEPTVMTEEKEEDQNAADSI